MTLVTMKTAKTSRKNVAGSAVEQRRAADQLEQRAPPTSGKKA